MRQHFLLALLLLIFTGGSNDFVRANQSIKAATRRGVRTSSQVTEGTQRSASVAEDETATIDEERVGGSKLDMQPLIRSMSLGSKEVADAEAVSSTSLNSLAMKNPAAYADDAVDTEALKSALTYSLITKAMQDDPKLLQNFQDMKDYLLQMKNPMPDKAAFIADVKDRVHSFDFAKPIKALLRDPTMTAEAKATLAKEIKEGYEKAWHPFLSALDGNPAAKENYEIFLRTISRMNPEKPEDQAAIIDAVNTLHDVPDFAKVFEAELKKDIDTRLIKEFNGESL